ncbi:FUSC family protein [Polaribacter sp. Asnod6-C07]|uniref:FUSC family protein n=1 Tax=Polaribacter sp. Asnod6-C07 TaxID=3160582 RepID=UPI003863C4F8
MITSFLRYIKSIQFLKAVLVALAMTIPVFISIYFFDSMDIGFSIALGAILSLPADINGSLKHKFYGILASIILAFTITLMVGYFSSYLLLIIPILIILVFSVSYISVFGFRASLISLAGLLALVLAFAYDSNEVSLLQHALFIALGGFWYLFLTLSTQLIFPKVQTDFLFFTLIEKTAGFIKLRGELLVEKEDRTLLLEKSFKLQIDINELHETLREVILERRTNAGFSNRIRRQQLIFSKLMEVYELAISNPINYKKFDVLYKDHPEKIDEFKVLIFEISERLLHISKVILKEEKLSFANNFKILLKKIENQIDLFELQVGLPESREDVILLLNYKTYQEKQIQNLNDIVRILSKYSKNDKIRGIKNAEQFITPQDYDLKKLRANFSIKSPIFRHSLRLTLTTLIGFIVGHIIELQQSYWILLTIIVIMRPSYSLTKERTKNRVIGTIIGALVGVAIVLITQNTIIYAIIAVISLIIGFSLVKQNYRNGAAFITLYVIFMYAIIYPNVLEVIQFRVFDTLIGALLAYAANHLFWPAWEARNMKDFLKESTNSFSNLLNEINIYYHKKGETSINYRLARKEAFLKVGNLNAAYQRFVQEPKSKQENSAIIYDLVSISNTFLSSLTSLGMFIRSNETGIAPEQFEIYVTNIQTNLKSVIDTTNDKENNNSLNTKELKIAEKNYKKHYKNLSSTRDEEIVKGIPISNEMKVALHETQLVFEQVKWLFNLSESLVKKINKI